MNRFCSVLFVALLCSFVHAADPKPAKADTDQSQAFTGKVQTLGTILAKQGIKVDADAADSVALVTGEGTTFSLVKDENSRALFLDNRLQDRALTLTAKKVAGSQMLQIAKIQSTKDGKLHDVIYWCDNCQMAWKEPGPCKCCGGETVLTEVLAKSK